MEACATKCSKKKSCAFFSYQITVNSKRCVLFKDTALVAIENLGSNWLTFVARPCNDTIPVCAVGGKYTLQNAGMIITKSKSAIKRLRIRTDLDECAAMCDVDTECVRFSWSEKKGGKCKIFDARKTDDSIPVRNGAWNTYVATLCLELSLTSTGEPSALLDGDEGEKTQSTKPQGLPTCDLGTNFVKRSLPQKARTEQRDAARTYSRDISIETCSARCEADSQCVAFNFNTGTFRCYTFAVLLESGFKIHDSDVWLVYDRTPCVADAIAPVHVGDVCDVGLFQRVTDATSSTSYMGPKGNSDYELEKLYHVSLEFCADICELSSECQIISYKVFARRCITFRSVDIALMKSANTNDAGEAVWETYGRSSECEDPHP
jgi:hypothetical protein